MSKAFNIIKTTLIWLVVALAVFMMIFTVISVTTFNRNDRDIFGYKAYIVNTDSLSKPISMRATLFLQKRLIRPSLKRVI